MKTSITIEIDSNHLAYLTDASLASLWHVTQANPAPLEDQAAGDVTEHVGREIIRRFLANTPPQLWSHQGRHAVWHELMVMKGTLPPSATAESGQEVSHG